MFVLTICRKMKLGPVPETGAMSESLPAHTGDYGINCFQYIQIMFDFVTQKRKLTFPRLEQCITIQHWQNNQPKLHSHQPPCST